MARDGIRFFGQVFGILSAAVCLTPLLSGCESSDPCALRTAACLDVTLIGKLSNSNDMVSYQNLVVTVTDVSGKMLASTPPTNLSEDPAPYAGLQAVITLQLPDSFNALPDMYTQPGQEPFALLDTLASDADRVAKLKDLRNSDPRAVHISVTGMEQSRTPGPVAWDSRIEEDNCFTQDEWLNRRYYRVGLNQYQAAYAPLLPPPAMPKACPKPPASGM